jgi:hypothetical protein
MHDVGVGLGHAHSGGPLRLAHMRVELEVFRRTGEYTTTTVTTCHLRLVEDGRVPAAQIRIGNLRDPASTSVGGRRADMETESVRVRPRLAGIARADDGLRRYRGGDEGSPGASGRIIAGVVPEIRGSLNVSPCTVTALRTPSLSSSSARYMIHR